MGVEIEAGDAALYTRAEAYLVTSWCNRFDERKWTDAEGRDRMGVIEYPAEIVRAAHKAVPLDYKAAKAAGFNVNEPADFASARRFLAHAADEPNGIRGSD